MLEQINEPIEVEVDFLKGKVLPRKFCWAGKIYELKKLTLVHAKRAGREKVYYFSVSDGINFFRLAFNTDNLEWRLDEMYAD